MLVNENASDWACGTGRGDGARRGSRVGMNGDEGGYRSPCSGRAPSWYRRGVGPPARGATWTEGASRSGGTQLPSRVELKARRTPTSQADQPTATFSNAASRSALRATLQGAWNVRRPATKGRKRKETSGHHVWYAVRPSGHAQGAPPTADRDPVGSIPLRRENQTAGGSRL